ncbi:MAG: alpha/beta hydrolase [Pseudomonadota bacterium]
MIEFKPSPDPATAELLEKIAASDLPPYQSLTPEAARKMYREAGAAAEMAEVAVAGIEDLSFDTPDGKIGLRLYRAVPVSDHPQPVLLYFHGGGFVIGDLDTHDRICRALCAASGAAVIAVDYRLAPEHPFPAAVEDAVFAFDWLLEHAQSLNLDKDQISVGGDSAGGLLAAYLAQVARDRGISLVAQALFYPVVDMTMSYPSYAEHADTPPITRDVLQWFWDHYLGASPSGQVLSDPKASPIRADSLAGTAPAFVVTAGLDPLRDEGAAYAHRLSQEGVEVVYQCCLGTVHGFMRVGAIVPAANDVISAAGAFLKARNRS